MPKPAGSVSPATPAVSTVVIVMVASGSPADFAVTVGLDVRPYGDVRPI